MDEQRAGLGPPAARLEWLRHSGKDRQAKIRAKMPLTI
jgi:hypothetical protein